MKIDGKFQYGNSSGPAESSFAEACATDKAKRVLVVESSQEIREIECRMLERRGYQVKTAVNGVDGWNTLCSGDFDLVLAGIRVSVLDGIELTELIRDDERFETLPVLVACDGDCDSDRRRLFEAGADYYVIKSKLQEHLVQTVASLIGPAKS